MPSTYSEVGRTTTGVLGVRSQVFNVLHRAPKEAEHILRVATLPVVPYLINHLSSNTDTSVPSPLDNVDVTIPRDAKRKEDLYGASNVNAGDRLLSV